MTPIGDEDLSAEILFEETLLVVAGTRNKWTRRRSIELAELIREPWAMPQHAEGSAAAAETFAACGLQVPRAEVVGGSIHLHHALIASGRLLGMWPASVLRFGAEHLSVKVLRVKMPVVPRPVGIITLKGRMISPVAQLFIDCAREVAKPLARCK